MKEKSIGKRYRLGIITLEVLLAFVVMTLFLSALMILYFGNQAIVLEAKLSNQALIKAVNEIEILKASEDFDNLKSVNFFDGIFNKNIEVLDITRCLKSVAVKFLWNNSNLNKGVVEFKSLISNRKEAKLLGGQCFDVSIPDEKWKSLEVSDFYFEGLGQSTDIAVFDEKIYISLNTQEEEKPDLFITDMSDLNSVSKLDTTDRGFVSMAIAMYPENGKTFLFVGLDSKRFDEDHLQIIEVTDFNNPYLVSTIKLPTIASENCLPNSGGCSVRSVYFYDKKLYIGTPYLGTPLGDNVNHEFYIYDVSDVHYPNYLGSRRIRTSVNDIVVKDDIAYLATTKVSEEFLVLDVSNPYSITEVGKFGETSSQEAGLNLDFLGNKIYFAKNRSPASRYDFYVYDVEDLSGIKILNLFRLGLSTNKKVSDFLVRGRFIFLTSTDSPKNSFKILEIKGDVLEEVAKMEFPEITSGIAFEDNTIFISTKETDVLKIIKPVNE